MTKTKNKLNIIFILLYPSLFSFAKHLEMKHIATLTSELVHLTILLFYRSVSVLPARILSRGALQVAALSDKSLPKSDGQLHYRYHWAFQFFHFFEFFEICSNQYTLVQTESNLFAVLGNLGNFWAVLGNFVVLWLHQKYQPSLGASIRKHNYLLLISLKHYEAKLCTG